MHPPKFWLNLRVDLNFEQGMGEILGSKLEDQFLTVFLDLEQNMHLVRVLYLCRTVQATRHAATHVHVQHQRNSPPDNVFHLHRTKVLKSIRIGFVIRTCHDTCHDTEFVSRHMDVWKFPHACIHICIYKFVHICI